MSYCIPGVGKTNKGYYRVGQKMAHRLAWIERSSPIPTGLDLHHLCGNRGCVNVDHLALVTRKEHAALHMVERTHCRRGHEWTDENTDWRKDGNRRCRACRREGRKS